MEPGIRYRGRALILELSRSLTVSKLLNQFPPAQSAGLSSAAARWVVGVTCSYRDTGIFLESTLPKSEN
jgi:hypothetical protein